MNKNEKIATVHRITVDEQLAEDLIRLEICELKKQGESGEFKDEPDFWEDIAKEGEEIMAKPLDPESILQELLYTDVMFIPESLVQQFPWKDLKEGQVFLSGAFEVKEEQRGDKIVKRYFFRPGKEAFEQIDDDVKENTKNLYFEILAKGEKSDKL